MKIIVYIPDSNDEHVDTLTAFSKGCDCEIRSIHSYKPSDLAVIFGIGKKNVPESYPRGNVLYKQKMNGAKTIVIEKGYIKRDKYYSVGFDNLNGRADFNISKMPSDRWDMLGVELKPYRDISEGKYLLLCGQVPSDASVQYIDINKWYMDMVARIKSIDDIPILFRPHPLAIDRTPHIEGTVWSDGTQEEDFEHATAVITFNSNTGVDALIEGIPVYSHDEGSMVYGVSSHQIDRIVHFDRTQWANDIAYTQWTREEMEQGLPLEHLLNGNFDIQRASDSRFKLA